MAKNITLFGAGNIGSEMKLVLEGAGYNVPVVVRKAHMEVARGDGSVRVIELEEPGNPLTVLRQINDITDLIDGIVSTIPGGDGEFENRVMKHFVTCGHSFVTAAKVALAKHYESFVPYLHRIGRMATVGGGTMMLDFMSKHLDPQQDSEVHAVVNGTMSYAMTNRWRNRSMAAILRECEALKLAEPTPKGEKPDVLKLFRGEIDDVIWKLMIMINEHYRHRIGRTVLLSDFRKVALTERGLQRILAPNTRRKYVVRITTREMEPEIGENDPGSIWANINHKVFISGGFYEIPAGSALASWVPDIGPGNAIQIDQGGTPAVMFGDGAGPDATCKSLLHDVRTLVPLDKGAVEPAFGGHRHHPRAVVAS